MTREEWRFREKWKMMSLGLAFFNIGLAARVFNDAKRTLGEKEDLEFAIARHERVLADAERGCRRAVRGWLDAPASGGRRSAAALEAAVSDVFNRQWARLDGDDGEGGQESGDGDTAYGDSSSASAASSAASSSKAKSKSKSKAAKNPQDRSAAALLEAQSELAGDSPARGGATTEKARTFI